MPDTDDTSPALVYSGDWRTQSHGQQFQTTAHYTTQVGATVRLVFDGHAVVLHSTNPNSNPGRTMRGSCILDGVRNDWTLMSHAQAYYQDRVWGSGRIDEGRHELIVENMGSDVPLFVDWFEVEGELVMIAPAGPPVEPPGGSPDTQPATVSADTHEQAPPSTPTQDLDTGTTTQSSPSTRSSGDAPRIDSQTGSTTTLTSTRLNTFVLADGQTVTETQTTLVNGAASEGPTVLPASTSDVTAGALQGGSLGGGTIAGIVLGSISLIALLAILFLLLKRRRRDRNQTPFSGHRMSAYKTLPDPFIVGERGLSRQATLTNKKQSQALSDPFNQLYRSANESTIVSSTEQGGSSWLSRSDTAYSSSASFTGSSGPTILMGYPSAASEKARIARNPFDDSIAGPSGQGGATMLSHSRSVRTDLSGTDSDFSYVTVADVPPPAYSA